jgi:acyl carrier protein
MTKSEFITQIEEMLEATPGVANENTPLDSMGWDSMSIVGFIAMADRKLGVSIPPAKLAKALTVADLIALVAEKLG